MDAPWFFSFLDLPADADERSIKRAYAARLKRIDQASDLEGFARLRQAYEGALGWCARQQAHAVAPAERLAVLHAAPVFHPPAPRLGESALASAEPRVSMPVDAAQPSHLHAPTAADEAHAAMQRLTAALGTGASARDALGEPLRMLHSGRLEAVAMFECLLIDALANGQLPQRVALFEAARGGLGWMDVNRLAQLGPRGRWIENVLAELPAWHRQIITFVGARWFDLIGEGHHPSVPRELASQWPRVLLLLRQCPHQLRLRLAPDTLAAWQAAFDALPALDRDLAETYAGVPTPAARRAARPRVGDARSAGRGVVFVIGIVMALRAIFGLLDEPVPYVPPAPVPASAPVPARQQAGDSRPTLCERLDVFVHKPGWQGSRDAQLADAVRQCIITGHWRALPDPALAKMGDPL